MSKPDPKETPSSTAETPGTEEPSANSPAEDQPNVNTPPVVPSTQDPASTASQGSDDQVSKDKSAQDKGRASHLAKIELHRVDSAPASAQSNVTETSDPHVSQRRVSEGCGHQAISTSAGQAAPFASIGSLSITSSELEPFPPTGPIKEQVTSIVVDPAQMDLAGRKSTPLPTSTDQGLSSASSGQVSGQAGSTTAQAGSLVGPSGSTSGQGSTTEEDARQRSCLDSMADGLRSLLPASCKKNILCPKQTDPSPVTTPTHGESTTSGLASAPVLHRVAKTFSSMPKDKRPPVLVKNIIHEPSSFSETTTGIDPDLPSDTVRPSFIGPSSTEPISRPSTDPGARIGANPSSRPGPSDQTPRPSTGPLTGTIQEDDEDEDDDNETEVSKSKKESSV